VTQVALSPVVQWSFALASLAMVAVKMELGDLLDLITFQFFVLGLSL
jgi:hypothetical protein